MTDQSKALLGGRALTVTFRDEHTEEVIVRELPIRHIQKLALTLDDEAAQAELYTGNEEGWDDTLTAASHEAVIKLGGELNFPLLQRWLERKGAAIAAVSPPLAKITAGRNLLPVLPPPAA
ncbi:MAG: hypothetical protein LBD30_00325 [Verrucomicrobiales bacterium]|jgi:hypothetical protein|nr:hypothetical protein [Verrucomicrobiales bacterium]